MELLPQSSALGLFQAHIFRSGYQGLCVLQSVKRKSVVTIGSRQGFIVREHILSHFDIWSPEDHPPWDVVISVPILNVEVLTQLGTP